MAASSAAVKLKIRGKIMLSLSPWVALAVLLAPLASAVPIGQEQQCASSCPEDDGSWGYTPGSTYTFNYEVDTNTAMKGASSQTSEVHMQATAKIHVINRCNFQLRIDDVEFGNGHGGLADSSYGPELTRFPLNFAFLSGQIPETCPHEDESLWALNVKRGLLSAFQNTLTTSSSTSGVSRNAHEVDVVGICPTSYKQEFQTDTETRYIKSKDMKECSRNQKLHQHALNIPDINIQHLPLLESRHECNVAIRDGILQSSKCREKHIFKPFSQGNSQGAITEQTQALEFRGRETGLTPEPLAFVERVSLLLTHEHKNDQKDSYEEALVVLQQFMDHPEINARPHLFTELTHALRKLNFSQLYSFFVNIQGESRRFALDAIPLLRTNAGVQLMVDRIQSGELDHEKMERWFYSLTFYKNPTTQMISALIPFLEGQPGRSAILGISALISTFCQSDKDCQADSEVQRAILKFEKILGSNCYAMGQEEEDRVVLALKALRNVGITINAEPVTMRCFQEKTNPMEIRLAAMDLARDLACRSRLTREALLQVISLTDNDSELRIGAYLALFKCPDKALVLQLKALLLQEPVNQVGSFIWTHLTNLQETRSLSAGKQFVKKLIGTEFLKNKWNTDVRKFSRYFETSRYNKEGNFGGTAEANIIFSQESYLPRSAMVNMSLSLFGEHLNLFELGGRIEGLESMIENLFGPEGKFREDTFHKILKSLRQKRDVESNEIASFQQTYNNYREEQPKGNYYFRMFGKDIWYESFLGLQDLWRKVSYYPGHFFGSKEQAVDLARSNIFLDGGITIPTMAGLPLKLIVNGTYSASLKSSVQMDTKDLFTKGQAKIQAHIYPTASVEIIGLMGVDAGVAQTGLKSVSTLYSNTFLDGSIHLRGQDGVSAVLNMPKDTVEVLEASVDFFTFEDQAFQPLVSENALEKSFQCTPDIYNTFFAVEACHHYQYHASQDNEYYFPASFFAGPSKFGFSFRKTDQFERYALVYGWSQVLDKEHDSNLIHKAKFSFDTPGSVQDHKTSVELVYDDIASIVGFDFTVPYRSIRGSAKYQWTAKQKVLKGAILADGVNLASMQVGLKSAHAEGRYGVRAHINYGDLEVLDWSGTFNVMRNKASLDGMMMGHFHTPVKVLADWSSAHNSATLRTTFNSKRLDFNFNGHASFNDDSFALGGDASYDWMRSGSKAIKLDAQYKTSSSGALKKHNIFISSKIPSHPNLQFETIWDIQTSTGYLENKAKFILAEETYALQQIVSSQQKSDLSEFLFKAWLEIPKSNRKYGVDFVQMASNQKGTNQLRLSYGKSFRFDTHFNYERQVNPGVYYFDAGIKYPSQRFQLLFDLKEESQGYLNGRTQVQWGETVKEQAEAEFRLKPGSKYSCDYAISVNLRPSDWKPISISGIVLSHAGRSLAEFKWIHGDQDYQLRLEHAPIQQGLESGIVGALKANEIDYNGTFIYRFDDVMSAFKLDVHAEKRVQVRFQVDTFVEDVEFSVYWDRDVDDSKRFLLKSQILPKQILAEFDFLIHSGSLDASFLPRGYAFKGKFDDQYLTTEAEWRLDDEVYGVRGIIESSFDPIKEGKVIVKHSFQRRVKPSRKTVMDTKIAVQLNDAVKHSISWKSEYNGISLLKAEIKTTSTYEPFNGHHAWINHYFQGGKFNSKAILNQNQQDLFDVTAIVEPMSHGLFRLSSGWQPLSSLEIHLNHHGKTIEGDFNLNKRHQGEFEVELDLKERWNHYVKVRASSSIWADFEGQWKLDQDDKRTQCKLLAVLGHRGIEWLSDVAVQDPDSSIHVQITKHCPAHPQTLVFQADHQPKKLQIIANRSASSQTIVNDFLLKFEQGKTGPESELRMVHYGQTMNAHFSSNEDGAFGDLTQVNDGEKVLDVRVVAQQQKEFVSSEGGSTVTDQQYVLDGLVWSSEITLGKVFLLGTIRNGRPLKFETKIEGGTDYFQSNMEIITLEGSEADMKVISKSESSYPFLQEAILEFTRELQQIGDSLRLKDRLYMAHNQKEYLAISNNQMGPEGYDINLSLTKDGVLLGQLEMDIDRQFMGAGALRLVDAMERSHHLNWNSDDDNGRYTVEIESPLLVDPVLLSCQYSLVNPQLELKAVYQVDVLHVLFKPDYNTGTSTLYGLIHPNWIEENSRFVLSLKYPFLSQMTSDTAAFKGQLNTPIEGWQEVAAEIQLDLSNANGMNRVEFDVQKQMQKYKGVIYTEYHPSQSIKLWGDLSLAGLNVNGDIVVHYDRQTIKVHYHHWSGDEIEAQVQFSPFTSGNMQSEVTIQMNGQDFAKMQVDIDLASETKTLAAELDVFPKQIWFRANGELSPASGLLTLERSMNQPTSTKSEMSYLQTENKGTIKVSLDVDKRRNIDLNWAYLDNDGMEIDLKTPMDSLKTLRIRLLKSQHSAKHMSLDLTADLNANSEISAQVNLKGEADVSATVKVESPYLNPIDIEVVYKLSESNREASLSLQTPFEAYNFLLHVSEDFHSARLDVEHASEGKEVFSSHLKYNTQEVFDQELTVHFDGSEGSVKLSNEGTIFNLSHPGLGQWGAKVTVVDGQLHARLSQDEGREFEFDVTGQFGHSKEIGEFNGRLFCKKWQRDETSEISASYDLHDLQKKLNLQGSLIAPFKVEFNVSSTFQFEHKKFQGNTVVISNLLERNLDLKLDLHIKPEPEMHFSYQFEGDFRNDINMLINMSNQEGVPFVRITTPFTGYQELLMIGSYKSGNGKNLFKITVKKEDQVVIEMMNKIQLDSGRVDLTSVLTTPFELWKRFQIGLSTRWQEPYSIKALVALNDDTYTLDGSMSLIQNEVYLEMATPVSGYESMIISGKSGTTSIGKSLGFSFEQNRQRRDLGFEYEIEENNFKASVQSPFDSLRRVKIVKRSAQDFIFDFETSGEALDLALGVHYEVVGSQGQVIIKVDLENAPGSRFHEVRSKVIFDRMDGDPSNGFLLEVQAEVDERKKFSLKAQKPDQRRPLTDLWEKLQDIVIEVEAKGREYSLHTLKTGDKQIQVNLRSPQPEFTSLQLSVHKKGDIAYDIKFNREDVEALNLSFEVPKDFSKIRLDLKANKNAKKWMNLHLSATPDLEEPQLDFKYESSSRKAELVSATFTTAVQASGQEKSTRRHFSGKFNDKMIEWDSTSSTLGKDHSKGSSKVVTNWEYLGFQERTTDYEKKDGKGGLPRWTYVTTQNGESQVSAIVQQLDDGFDISYVGVSPMKDKKELEVQAQIRTNMKSTAKVTILTNIPTFRKLEAQGALTLRLNPTNIGLKLRVRQNDKDVLKMGLGFLEPKAKAYKMPIQISFVPFNFQQKLEVLAEGNPSGQLKSSIKAKGTLMDVNSQLEIDITQNSVLIIGKADVNLKASRIKPFDVTGRFSLKNNLVDMTLKNAKKDRTHHIVVGLTSPQHLKLMVDSPWVPFIKSKLNYEIRAQNKFIEGQLELGQKKFASRLAGTWSRQASNLRGKLETPKGTYILTSVRDNVFEKVSFELRNEAIAKPYITINLRANGDSSSSFEFQGDIMASSLHPQREKPNYLDLTINLEGKPSANNGRHITGTASVRDYSIDIEYIDNPRDKTFTLTLESQDLPIKKLALDLQNRDAETKSLTIVLGERQFTIYTNLHTIRSLEPDQIGLIGIKGNDVVPTAELNIDFGAKQFRLVYSGRDLFLRWTGSMTLSNTGAEFTAKLEATGYFSYDFDLDGSVRTDEKHKALAVNLRGNGDPYASASVGVDMKPNNAGSLVQIKLNYEGQEAKELIFKGDLEDTEESRSVTMDINYNNKLIKGTLFWNKSGKFKVLLDSPYETLQHFEYVFNNEQGKVESVLQFIRRGQVTKAEVRTQLEAKKLYSVGMLIRNDNEYGSLNFDANLEARSLDFKAEWQGQKISLTSRVSGKDVTIKVTSPYENMKDVTLNGRWERTSSGLRLKASSSNERKSHDFVLEVKKITNDESTLFWSLREDTNEIKFTLNTKKTSLANVDINLDLTSHKGNLIRLGIKYYVLNKFLHAELTMNCPSIQVFDGKSKFHVGFVSPRNMQILLMSEYSKSDSTSGGSETLFNIVTELQFEEFDNVVLKFEVEVPSLGLDQGDVSLEVVFRVQAKEDFEVAAKIGANGKLFNYGIKYRRTEDGEIESRIRFTGPDLQFDLSVEGQLNWKGDMKSAKLAMREEGLNWGEGEFNLKYDTTTRDSQAKLYVKCKSGQFDDPLRMEYTYVHEESLRLSGQMFDQGSLTIAGKKTEDIVSANFESDFLPIKSASFLLEEPTNGKGRFELSAKRAEDSKLNFRVRRDIDEIQANIVDPKHGEINLIYGQETQNVLFFKTKEHFHQLSYGFDDDQVFLHVNSPLLAKEEAKFLLRREERDKRHEIEIMSFLGSLKGELYNRQERLGLDVHLSSDSPENGYGMSIDLSKAMLDGRAKIQVREDFYEVEARNDHSRPGEGSMGVSVGLNEDRKEFGFAYEVNDDGMVVDVHSPVETLKAFKVVNKVKRDTGQVEFKFEAEGNEDLLLAGAGIRFDQNKRTLEVLLKTPLLPGKYGNLQLEALWNNVDRDMSNGFDINVEVKASGELIQKVSFSKAPSPGLSDLRAIDAIKGFSLNISSQDKTIFDLETLETPPGLFKLRVLSNYPGRKLMELNLESSFNWNDQVGFKLDVNENSIVAFEGKVNKDTDMMATAKVRLASVDQSKFGEFEITLTPIIALPSLKLKATSSHPKLKILDLDFQMTETDQGQTTKQIRTLDFKFNDKFVTWRSESTNQKDSPDSAGTSITKTNMVGLLGFNEQTTAYEIASGDDNSANFWSYQTDRDGELNMRAVIERVPNGFDISYKGKSPLDGKNLEMQVKLRTNKQSTFNLKVKTNIATLREIELKGSWRSAGKKHELKGLATLNGDEVGKMGVGFRSTERSAAVSILMVVKPIRFNQQFSLSVANLQNMPKKLSLKTEVRSRGTILDLTGDLSLVLPKNNQELPFMDLSAFGALKSFQSGPKTFDVTTKLEMGKQKLDLDLVYDIQKQRGKHHINASLTNKELDLKILMEHDAYTASIHHKTTWVTSLEELWTQIQTDSFADDFVFKYQTPEHNILYKESNDISWAKGKLIRNWELNQNGFLRKEGLELVYPNPWGCSGRLRKNSGGERGSNFDLNIVLEESHEGVCESEWDILWRNSKWSVSQKADLKNWSVFEFQVTDDAFGQSSPITISWKKSASPLKVVAGIEFHPLQSWNKHVTLEPVSIKYSLTDMESSTPNRVQQLALDINNGKRKLVYSHERNGNSKEWKLLSNVIPVSPIMIKSSGSNESTGMRNYEIRIPERSWFVETNMGRIPTTKSSIQDLDNLVFKANGHDDFPVIDFHLSRQEGKMNLNYSRKSRQFNSAVTFDETTKTTQASISLDTPEQKMATHISIQLGDQREIGVKVSLDNLSWMEASIVFEGGSLTQGSTLTGSFAFPQQAQTLDFKANTESKADVIRGGMTITFNGKEANLRLLKTQEGILSLDLTTDLSTLKRLKVVAEYQSRGTTVLDLLMEGNRTLMANFESNMGIEQVYGLALKAELDGKKAAMTSVMDLSKGGRKFVFDSQWLDQTLTLKAESEGSKVEINISSTLQEISDVNVEGTWSINENGGTIKATGEHEGNPVTFELNYGKIQREYSLEWSLSSSVTKEVKFTWITDFQNIKNLESNLHLLVDDDLLSQFNIKIATNDDIRVSSMLSIPRLDIIMAKGQLRMHHNGPNDTELKASFHLQDKVNEETQVIFDTQVVGKVLSPKNFDLQFKLVLPALNINPGDVDVGMVLSLESATDFEVETRIGVKGELYQARLQLERDEDGKGVKAGVTLKGLGVNVESDFDYIVLGEKRTSKINFVTLSNRTGAKRQLTSEFEVDCSSGSLSISFNLDNVHDDVPPISLVVEAKQWRTLEGFVTKSDAEVLQWNIVCSPQDKTFQAEISSDIAPVQSIQMRLNWSKPGEMEFWILKNPNHKTGIRVKRDMSQVSAVFHDPHMGDFHFELGEHVKSGILVMKTRHAIHKLSYDLTMKDSFYDIKFDLRSPFLQKGSTQFHLIINPKGNHYKVKIDSEFGSIQSNVLLQDRGMTFQFQSVALSKSTWFHSMNMKLKVRNSENVALFDFGIVPNELLFWRTYDCRLYLDKNNLRGDSKLRISNLIDFKAHGSLSFHHEGMIWDGKIQSNGRKLNIYGEITTAKLDSWDASVVIEESSNETGQPQKVSLSGGFHWTESKKLIFIQSLPDMPDNSEILFHLDVTHGTFEATLPFIYSVQKLRGTFSVDDDFSNCAIQMEVNGNMRSLTFGYSLHESEQAPRAIQLEYLDHAGQIVGIKFEVVSAEWESLHLLFSGYINVLDVSHDMVVDFLLDAKKWDTSRELSVLSHAQIDGEFVDGSVDLSCDSDARLKFELISSLDNNLRKGLDFAWSNTNVHQQFRFQLNFGTDQPLGVWINRRYQSYQDFDLAFQTNVPWVRSLGIPQIHVHAANAKLEGTWRRLALIFANMGLNLEYTLFRSKEFAFNLQGQWSSANQFLISHHHKMLSDASRISSTVKGVFQATPLSAKMNMMSYKPSQFRWNSVLGRWGGQTFELFQLPSNHIQVALSDKARSALQWSEANGETFLKFDHYHRNGYGQVKSIQLCHLWGQTSLSESNLLTQGIAFEMKVPRDHVSTSFKLALSETNGRSQKDILSVEKLVLPQDGLELRVGDLNGRSVKVQWQNNGRAEQKTSRQVLGLAWTSTSDPLPSTGGVTFSLHSDHTSAVQLDVLTIQRLGVQPRTLSLRRIQEKRGIEMRALITSPETEETFDIRYLFKGLKELNHLDFEMGSHLQIGSSIEKSLHFSGDINPTTLTGQYHLQLDQDMYDAQVSHLITPLDGYTLDVEVQRSTISGLKIGDSSFWLKFDPNAPMLQGQFQPLNSRGSGSLETKFQLGFQSDSLMVANMTIFESHEPKNDCSCSLAILQDHILRFEVVGSSEDLTNIQNIWIQPVEHFLRQILLQPVAISKPTQMVLKNIQGFTIGLLDDFIEGLDDSVFSTSMEQIVEKKWSLINNFEFFLEKSRHVLVELSRLADFQITIERQYLRALLSVSRTLFTEVTTLVIDSLDVGVVLFERNMNSGIECIRMIAPISFWDEHVFPHLEMAWTQMNQWWFTNRLAFTESSLKKICVFANEFSQQIRQEAFQFFKELHLFLKQAEFFQSTLEFYWDYQSWLEEIHFSEHVENALGDAASAISRGFSVGKAIHLQIKSTVSNLWNGLEKELVEVVEQLPLPMARRLAEKSFNFLSYSTSLFTDMTSLREIFKVTITQIDAWTGLIFRMTNVIFYGNDIPQLVQTHEPDQRLYRATFTSPLEWTSFKETPKIIQVIEHLHKPERANDVSFDMLEFQHDILEAINTLNAAITTRNVVPPFSAHAQIIGNGQIRSFDGTFFSFRPTNCSYLLVSDFLHNRFSLSVHYNDGQRTHLSFTDGKTLIAIDNNLKVTVKGRQMRLPQLIGSTFIQRYKNRLMLESGDGLKLECNSVSQICSATVSGWYFGKTGGLFGIYDNEPSNDFMAPNRDILVNPISFVQSWQLSQNTRTCSVTPYTTEKQPSGMDLSAKCRHLFTSPQSALMPCFETVDPTKYESFCAQDQEGDDSVCRSSAAYIEYCKLKAIELWMPSECVSCTDDQNQDYVVGSSQTLEGKQLPRSADVVILIESNACFKNMSLNSIPTYLDYALTKEGIEKNRFGVVGFGGNDPHYQDPMPYTAMGEDIFTRASKIEDALKGVTNVQSGDSLSNMYEALQFSGRLPFRAGVIKMVIHVSCHEGSTSNLVQSPNYGDALTMLKEQNIVFHRLQPNSFTYRSGKHGSEPILGLSSDDLFTATSLDQNRKHPELRRQVQVPKHDVLTTLALESGGVVFDAQSLISPLNPGDEKILSSLFAQRVSKLAIPASCQICDCIPGSDGEGYLQCRSCIQHEFDLLLLPSAQNHSQRHVSNQFH